MTPAKLRDLVVTALDDGKGQDILALDVSEASSITDFMVLVSGTSSRHVKSLVDHVVRHAKARGRVPLALKADGTLTGCLWTWGMCLSTSCRMKPGASMTLSASGPCRRSNSPRNCFSSCAISSLRRGSARPFVGRGGIPGICRTASRAASPGAHHRAGRRSQKSARGGSVAGLGGHALARGSAYGDCRGLR